MWSKWNITSLQNTFFESPYNVLYRRFGKRCLTQRDHKSAALSEVSSTISTSYNTKNCFCLLQITLGNANYILFYYIHISKPFSVPSYFPIYITLHNCIGGYWFRLTKCLQKFIKRNLECFIEIFYGTVKLCILVLILLLYDV